MRSLFADKREARPIATQRRIDLHRDRPGRQHDRFQSLSVRRQVIDVSGDGPNNSGDPVTPARDKAVEAGMIINGLAIMLRPSDAPNGLDKYYADCVIGGPGAFVLPVRKIEDFAIAVRRKLVLEISYLSPPAMVQKIAGAEAGTDCLIGEKQWRDIFDR
ncbi:DUF1194 domain-containing protein [Rhizobium beringeri]